MFDRDLKPLLLLAAVLLIALIARFAYLDRGLPFMYEEDEAHHFNRTVRMVQSGDWNPHYFHKPSLHFYLRAPVVAASFLQAAKKGQLSKIDQIQTRDRFGIGGYSFTASHPSIVKWNRAFSVLLSLVTLALVFLVGLKVSGNLWAATIGSLVVALSADFAWHSTIIGVDVLMTALAVATAFMAFRLKSQYSLPGLIVLALLAGLTVSAKYNALPVFILPLLICAVLKRFSPAELFIALVFPWAGFLLGSPYILVEFPTFLNHLAYEIWHYGTAGHQGHTAAPGLGQIVFYFKWLMGGAFGIPALLLALGGVVLSFKQDKTTALLIFAFPILFFILMILQKANFTRNMIVLIPFLGIALSVQLAALFNLPLFKKVPAWLSLAGLTVVLLALPTRGLGTLCARAHKSKESRLEAIELLKEQTKQVAVSGKLLLPLSIFPGSTLDRLDPGVLSPESLFQGGFERVLVGPESTQLIKQTTALKIIERIEGESEALRIIQNPEIHLLELNQKQLRQNLLTSLHQLPSVSLSSCGKEGWCWSMDKLSLIELSEISPSKLLEIEVMSPWPGQQISIYKPGELKPVLRRDIGSDWQNIPLPPEIGYKGGRFVLESKIVDSPSPDGKSGDTRRLGTAIRIAD